jgi:hypothetical protein
MPKKKNRPIRDVKPVLHIYCEGEKTEPNYFNGYLEKFFPTNRRLKVIKIETTKKNTPKQLVDVAIAAKKNSLDDDVFWVVYDRESVHKYPDQLHAAAYCKAQKNAIFLAISNVCFEAWLLLHFQEANASYSCYDDLRSNSILRDECKKRGISDYDKGNIFIFTALKVDEIKDARERAKRINEQTINSADPSRTKPYQWNPYTDVYKLLDAIDELANK